MTFSSVVEKFSRNLPLTGEDFLFLLTGLTGAEEARLYALARETALAQFGNRIFIRGLIEISNICKNDCYYCGIRKSNSNLTRYRLTREQILSCCEAGYPLGFRTFVLQGGEDGAFTDDWLCSLLKEIKSRFSDCAVTLSSGGNGGFCPLPKAAPPVHVSPAPSGLPAYLKGAGLPDRRGIYGGFSGAGAGAFGQGFSLSPNPSAPDGGHRPVSAP